MQKRHASEKFSGLMQRLKPASKQGFLLLSIYKLDREYLAAISGERRVGAESKIIPLALSKLLAGKFWGCFCSCFWRLFSKSRKAVPKNKNPALLKHCLSVRQDTIIKMRTIIQVSKYPRIQCKIGRCWRVKEILYVISNLGQGSLISAISIL